MIVRSAWHRGPRVAQRLLSELSQGRRATLRSAMSSAPCIERTGVLPAAEDKYDGMIVDPSRLSSLSTSQFSADLQHSLKTWASEGKRGIWLDLPLDAVHLVEPAVKLGFVPHHAESHHIMLVHWLPDAPNTLPPSATHQVGVGAFVVNERQEVLVVQERNGPLRGRNVWKMPTGLIHKGEDLHEGAEREVLEETGIRAKFDCVLAVRQAHGFAFNNSDLFLVCGLTPDPGQDQVTPQESEVVDAKWMPLSEYEAQPFMQGVELHDKLRERCGAYARGQYRGWRGGKLKAGLLAQHRHDLLLWGEDEEQEVPAERGDVVATGATAERHCNGVAQQSAGGGGSSAARL